MNKPNIYKKTSIYPGDVSWWPSPGFGKMDKVKYPDKATLKKYNAVIPPSEPGISLFPTLIQYSKASASHEHFLLNTNPYSFLFGVLLCLVVLINYFLTKNKIKSAIRGFLWMLALAALCIVFYFSFSDVYINGVGAGSYMFQSVYLKGFVTGIILIVISFLSLYAFRLYVEQRAEIREAEQLKKERTEAKIIEREEVERIAREKVERKAREEAKRKRKEKLDEEKIDPWDEQEKELF